MGFHADIDHGTLRIIGDTDNLFALIHLIDCAIQTGGASVEDDSRPLIVVLREAPDELANRAV